MLFNPTAPPTDLDAAFFALVTGGVTPPVPPIGDGLCQISGFIETPERGPAIGEEVTITLCSEGPLRRGARVIGARTILGVVGEDGQLMDADGEVIAVDRNDALTPLGSHYEFTCVSAQIRRVVRVLNQPTFDIADLVAATE